MKKRYIRKQTGIFLCMISALMLSACGSKNPTDSTKQTFGAESTQKSEKTEERKEENRFCGEWILAGYEYGERENSGDTEIRNPYYLVEDESINSKILIYSENDQLYADYYHFQYDATTINGMAFEEETATAENQPTARLKTG